MLTHGGSELNRDRPLVSTQTLTVGVQWEALRPIEDLTPAVLTIH